MKLFKKFITFGKYLENWAWTWWY